MHMYDIQSLQDSFNTKLTDSVSSGIQDQISQIIAWTVIPSIIITVVIIVLYVLHTVRRRKVENAILEIRDTLRDIKLLQARPPESQQNADDPAVTTPHESTVPTDAVTGDTTTPIS